MIDCITCNKETTNPKFCSKSCAATYNNKMVPKRYKTNKCLKCSDLIWKDRTYCRACWRTVRNLNWRQKTLGEFRIGNANQYGYPMIRADSRRTYINSGKPMLCHHCSYDLHVDICHIKDIKDFDDITPIGVINDLSNLVALCKNHHWEFDHNVLALSS